jgi:GNAT superfamily N-acetyltransferase
MHSIRVRVVRADEWEPLRDLRLEALREDSERIAFTASFEDAAAQPDEFWKGRARSASEDAGDGAAQRTFVATQDGRWLGTATVLITEAGAKDFTGRRAASRVADLVAVYVTRAARGAGVIQALMDAASAWAATRGLAELQLYVNAQNPRAQRAYEKSGFTRTGDELRLGDAVELRMVRPVAVRSDHRVR